MREMVYLKLTVEEDQMIINKLNKRVKFLVESHRDIKNNIIQEYKVRQMKKN